MARRVQNLDVELTHLKMLAVLEEVVEVTAVRRQVHGVEDRPEDALNILDVLADANWGAGLSLDVRSPGEMIGMSMRLQYP